MRAVMNKKLELKRDGWASELEVEKEEESKEVWCGGVSDGKGGQEVEARSVL